MTKCPLIRKMGEPFISNSPSPMNNIHLHLDEQKTQKVSDDVIKGKGEIIIACDQCRANVIKVLEQKLTGDEKMDGLIRTQKTQLEMTAFHYKEEVARLLKVPKKQRETNFGNYLKKVLRAKKIIGGNKVLAFPDTKKKEEELEI